MAKVESWTPEKFKVELAKRLKSAKKFRENNFEEQWRINERTVLYYNSRQKHKVTLTEDNLIGFEDDGTSYGMNETEMAVNYAWKFLRFIHSQMSANPPSVIARPTSTDMEDRLKADAADRVVRYVYSEEDIAEVFDQCNLKTLAVGSGYVRVYHDPDDGDSYEFDEKASELTMSGKICVYSPSSWDIWLDPNARMWKSVRHFFERVEMPVDEALFLFQDQKDDIEQFVKKRAKGAVDVDTDDHPRPDDEIVEIYYYCERALPINGMAGRMACCLEDGTVLGKPSKNTNPDQGLGLAMETDIDIPDQVYGASFIQYIYKLQELLNRLDTAFVDQVAAHGVVRMVLPDGAEIEEESLSNSSWDYVKITGNSGNGPYFVPPAQLMPDIHKLRENLIQGIQELAGVNDSMLGVQKREMSGFSMQTAIDAGNQTRRRLFNKYTLCVRDVFKMYLSNVVKYWDEPHTLRVLGKEKAFESADLKGADIKDGYDITCEYGASLSLDPSKRREEIMQLMPVFEKAGVPTKTILSMLKLNELEGLYDRMQMSADRQREVFETMIAKRQYIAPTELQDHAGMLDFAYYYVMTSTYKYLDSESQGMIDKHILEREQWAAKAATKGQGAPGAAAGEPPPAAPPVGGGLAPAVLTQGNAAPEIAPAA